jgi:hypothetical protein
MKPNLSGGGVTIAGLLLAGVGVYAMWTGWDVILLERGWSLFISGAVMLSGGVVTMALGRVIAHMARLAAQPALAVASEKQEAPAQAAAEAVPARPKVDVRPARAEVAPPIAPKPVEAMAPEPKPPGAVSDLFIAMRKAEAPTEVDRYEAGDSTYVMMSDGSVEVLGPHGRQRYASLAALKADAGLREP